MAVLPIGVSISERDANLMAYLKNVYDFRIHKKVTGVSFAGKEPNVILAELCRPQMMSTYVPKKSIKRIYDFLHRGCRNVVDVKDLKAKNGIRFIHTTNLIGNKLVDTKVRLSQDKARVLVGPAVLVPRVGTPNVTKVVVIGERKKYILSDCVIAILARDDSSAYHIQDILVSKRNSFCRLYAGTGARFITLSRLGKYIEKVVPSNYLRSNIKEMYRLKC